MCGRRGRAPSHLHAIPQRCDTNQRAIAHGLPNARQALASIAVCDECLKDETAILRPEDGAILASAWGQDQVPSTWLGCANRIFQKRTQIVLPNFLASFANAHGQ
jgi:hypothetical protein